MLLLSPSRGVWALTSQTTADFLMKLNRYYYCLSREGIKHYRCDLSCSLSPSSENNLRSKGLYDAHLWEAIKGFQFSVKDAAGEPISIEVHQISKTGDPKLDAQLEQLDANMAETLKAFFQLWKVFVVEPLNNPADMQQGNLAPQKLPLGFRVIQSDPSGVAVAASFDSKGKMLAFSIGGNGPPITVQPTFIYSAKGYLLKGLAFTAANAGQVCKLGYGVVDHFWMPNQLGIRFQLPGESATFLDLLFIINHYQINR